MTPTLEEAKAYAVEIGLPEEEGENFWYYFDSQDWKKANGQKLAKWRSGLQTWKRNRRRYDAPQSRQDGSGRAGTPKDTLWALKTRKEALEASMAALAFRSRHEGPLGVAWSNEEDRAKYIEFKKQLKEIQERMVSV